MELMSFRLVMEEGGVFRVHYAESTFGTQVAYTRVKQNVWRTATGQTLSRDLCQVMELTIKASKAAHESGA